MSRGPLPFKQNDLTRAVKAFAAAGVDVARYEICKNGTIIVVPGKPSETTEGSMREHTELEQWEEKRARNAQRDQQQAKTAR